MKRHLSYSILCGALLAAGQYQGFCAEDKPAAGKEPMSREDAILVPSVDIFLDVWGNWIPCSANTVATKSEQSLGILFPLPSSDKYDSAVRTTALASGGTG